MKIKENIMKHKKCLTAVVVIGGICVFAKMWSWNPEKAVDHVIGINTPFENEQLKMQEKPEVIDNARREIQYTSEGVYLLDVSGEVLCGPYKMIYEDSIAEYYRFIGENGLIGYLSKTDGNVVISPQFIRATPMYEGTALVSEYEDEGIYYVSSTGERVTKNYKDGYPYSESQGQYARVMLPDGTWSIINRKDEILANFKFMNPLPWVYTIGSAVNNNGNAIIYELPAEGNEEFKQIREFLQFCEISEFYMGEFAVVKNREGYYGVVHNNADIILEDEYKTIEWKTRYTDENIDSDGKVLFIVQKKDNTYDTIVWNE